MLQIRTHFLTPGWKKWETAFLEFTAMLQGSAPPTEEGWVSVGERQNVGGLVATIERQKATWTISGWTAGPGSEPGTWRYEHIYGPGDPTPGEVAEDIRRILTAPPSGDRKRG